MRIVEEAIRVVSDPAAGCPVEPEEPRAGVQLRPLLADRVWDPVEAVP
jgi:hypothetical protein